MIQHPRPQPPKKGAKPALAVHQADSLCNAEFPAVFALCLQARLDDVQGIGHLGGGGGEDERMGVGVEGEGGTKLLEAPAAAPAMQWTEGVNSAFELGLPLARAPRSQRLVCSYLNKLLQKNNAGSSWLARTWQSKVRSAARSWQA